MGINNKLTNVHFPVQALWYELFCVLKPSQLQIFDCWLEKGFICKKISYAYQHFDKNPILDFVISQPFTQFVGEKIEVILNKFI